MPMPEFVNGGLCKHDALRGLHRDRQQQLDQPTIVLTTELHQA
jgi:hypothetical protein